MVGRVGWGVRGRVSEGERVQRMIGFVQVARRDRR